jgi:tetratricopeptide (TPR) repeat protein
MMTLSGALVAATGCAADRPGAAAARPATAPAAEVAPPADHASTPDDATLPLDDIPGRPDLARIAPTSQPTDRPPIEAINLYAEAVDALQTGQRFMAIARLREALELDPNSFELHYALGRAHEVGRSPNEQSILAYERAAEINPDHLELQTKLGRHHLLEGNPDKALEHLRLALQTTAYAADESGAAMADLFLARALQEGGYDRAALEQYAKLLRRVQGRTLSLRHEPHLAFLLTNQLYLDIGDLYARNGMYADALSAYQPIAAREPADFDVQARLVRALARLRRYDEAVERSADLVVRFQADKPSLELLREVRRASGRDADGGTPSDELAAALARRPGDAAVLYALVELLRQDGRWAEAEGHLAKRAERNPGDFEVVRRWVELRLQRDDPEGAARLLIETLAERPDFAGELEELWANVISPARPHHLRLAQLRAMGVFPWQAAAKELGVAAVAERLRRDAVADEALARAVAARPAFAPAFRQRMVRLWVRRPGEAREASDAGRDRLVDELIAAAAADGGGDPALAQELTGLSLLYRKQYQPAADALTKAVEMAGDAPASALLHAQAMAFRGAGNVPKFEQIMWRLLSDRPAYEDAYSTLYAYYSEAGADGPMGRVLNTWLGAVPSSPSARLLHALGHFRDGRPDVAAQLMSRLLSERGDDPGVIGTAHAFYVRAGRLDALIGALEARVKEQPGNVAAAAALVELYGERGRQADAAGVVDAARAALARDPDHLYQVAHLYTGLGQRPAAEAALRQVLDIEPSHPGASNDLGYGLAERGENLAAAEGLIRQAVAAEPANASYLDSLGWVLYKRGKFAEARPHLERAAGDGASADPVVLDHLGDLLYRLGDRDAAATQWERAGAKLAERPSEREDLKQLKHDLDRKAGQLKAGQPVTVSPVVEEPSQAKNR